MKKYVKSIILSIMCIGLLAGCGTPTLSGRYNIAEFHSAEYGDITYEDRDVYPSYLEFDKNNLKYMTMIDGKECFINGTIKINPMQNTDKNYDSDYQIDFCYEDGEDVGMGLYYDKKNDEVIMFLDMNNVMIYRK